MTRYGIISDIHGNLSALETILDWFNGQIDALWCLGDFVGYPYGNECIELLRQRQALCILGNHDIQALIERCDPEAPFVTRKGQSMPFDYGINDDHKNYIRTLRKSVRVGETVFLQHGFLIHPKVFVFNCSDDPDNIEKHLQNSRCKLNFVGHSHIPRCFTYDWRNQTCCEKGVDESLSIELQADHSYIFDVGSIGDPRDGKAGSFAMYDSEVGVVAIRRFDQL